MPFLQLLPLRIQGLALRLGAFFSFSISASFDQFCAAGSHCFFVGLHGRLDREISWIFSIRFARRFASFDSSYVGFGAAGGSGVGSGFRGSGRLASARRAAQVGTLV